MLIQSLELDAFGLLQKKIAFSEDRLNLIVAPNEAGKSTLVRGLDALLYGLSDEPVGADGSGERSERAVYRPWEHERYFLSGIVSVDGEMLRLSREPENASLEVTETSDGDEVTDRYRDEDGEENVGRQLTGLGRTTFRNSVLVNQGDIVLLEERGDLVQAIQRMADSSGGETTAQEALEQLRSTREQFAGRFLADQGSVGEEQKRVEDRLETVCREMERLKDRRDRAENKIRNARDLKKRIREIEDEIDRIDLYESVSRMRQQEKRLDRHRKQQEKLDELREEKEALEEYEGFPHGQQEHLLRAHEQRKQILEEAEELASKEEDLKANLDEVNRKLDDMKSSVDLEPGDVSELLEFCEQALYYRSEIEELRRELDGEREELKKPDRKRERFIELQATFEDLEAEDREILTGMSQRLRSLSDQEAEAEREISEARDRVREIDRERAGIKLRSTIVSSTGGILLISGMSLYFWWEALPHAVSYGSMGLGLALGVYGLLRLLRADHHRSDERSEWKVKLEQRSEHQSRHVQKRKQLQKRATTVAGTLGLDGVEDLLERYETYRNLYEELESLLQIESQIQRLQTKLSNLMQRYSTLLDRCDHELDPESSTDEFQALKENLNRYRERLKRKASIETDLADLQSRRTELERKQAGKESTLRSILDRAGIDPDECSLNEGVERFKTHYDKYIRLQSLKEKIPEIEKTTMSPEKLQETRRMYKQLSEHLEAIREERPELDVPDELATPETYERKRSSLEQKKRALIAERADLEREAESLESRYRQRFPKLEDEREELVQYKERLERLSDALELAEEVLENVAEEVHAEWAHTLNQHTSRVIERITPGYRNVRFDSDLTFTIESVEDSTTLSTAEIRTSLSQGTKEQIFLAVRLGLAQYMSSRSEPLPVILDEPFAHFDDERFERCFRFLVEHVVPDHQVILLTCHGSRIEWLRDRDPNWFEEHVQSVDLAYRNDPAGSGPDRDASK